MAEVLVARRQAFRDRKADAGLGSLITLLIAASLAGPSWAQEAAPLPPPRPDRPAIAPVTPPANMGEPKAETGKEPATCVDRIRSLNVRFETQSDVLDNACQVKNAVLVTGLENEVDIAPPSLMTCALAESLARWSSDHINKESEKHFQAKPKKLLIGTSYQCRNQRSGEKLSEHAFGNAIDVMALEFDSRKPFTIGFPASDTPEWQFQESIRKGACSTFTTVLGPGSDEAHANHLHLDMRERKGGYRICQ